MTQGQWRRASPWPEGGSSGSSHPTPNSSSGDARVPEDELKKSGTEIWRYKDLSFSLSSPHQTTILTVPCHSCCCSLPVPVNVFKHLDASFSQSKPLSQLQHRYGPLLRLRLRSLCSFMAALLPNFNKTVRRELLIMEVQQIDDVFNILCTNIRAWINTSDLEEKELSTERRKCGRLPYCGESAVLRWPPSPYQFRRCILFFLNPTVRVQTTLEALGEQKLWERELSSYASSQ
jgi:hypothetical protein